MVPPGVKGLHKGCKEIHGGPFSSFLRLFLIGSWFVKLKHCLSLCVWLSRSVHVKYIAYS